ncbi:MAG: hypothetical protein GSR80_001148 [Desulfurococcales archaeon]|nr:hypothetical protein [Desulfurococcales archaeon]
MKSIRLYIASLLLLAAVALAPVAAAAPPASSQQATGLKGQATVSPRKFSITLDLASKAPKLEGIDKLSAHLLYGYNNKTCASTLQASLSAQGSKLKGIKLDANAVGSLSVNSSAGLVVTALKEDSMLDLSLSKNATGVNLTVKAQRTLNSRVNTTAHEGVSTVESHEYVYLNIVNQSVNIARIEANVTSETHTTLHGNTTLTDLTAEGPVAVKIPMSGHTFQVAFKLAAHIKVNETLVSENKTYINVHGTVNMTFKDYVTAFAIYQYLSMIVSTMNLTSHVQLTPPTMQNPTIVIRISYEGYVTPETLEGLRASGPAGHVGAPAGAPSLQVLENLTGKLPLEALPTSLPNGTLEGTYTLKAHASGGELEATLQARSHGTGGFCKANYSIGHLELNVAIDEVANKMQVHLSAAGKTGDPFTPTLASAKALYKLIDDMKDELQSVDVTFKSADGVYLVVNGVETHMATFTLKNYEDLKSLGVEYAGMRMHGGRGLVEVVKPVHNLTLPPIAKGAVLKGVGRVNITLPLHGRLHKRMVFRFLNSIAPNATIILHPGARVKARLHMATLPPDQVKLPPTVKAHKAGPALEVDGVQGVVTVVLPYNPEYPGKPAVLVIHSNGTVEIVENVTVEHGYIIANVSASSVFAPITLPTGGGGGGETTTTTTTTGTTTTQTTSTTTQTTTSTTTSQSTTSTTSQTRTSTTPTPTTTTSGITATTTTSQSTTKTTPKPSTTSQTSSTQATQTTKAKKGLSTGVVAGIVVVIVVIAAAAALLARR